MSRRFGRLFIIAQQCRRPTAALAAALALGLVTAGCSISLPGFGWGGDDDPAQVTGSIGPAKAGTAGPGLLGALGEGLDPEDIRRAEAAFTLALDPQGNGAPVKWDNPESKALGSFTPLGGPELKRDEICRAFSAEVKAETVARTMQGDACRPSGGTWRIVALKPQQAALR